MHMLRARTQTGGDLQQPGIHEHNTWRAGGGVGRGLNKRGRTRGLKKGEGTELFGDEKATRNTRKTNLRGSLKIRKQEMSYTCGYFI